MITIHAQLIDGEVREMGYIIYVFKNLEPSDPKEVYKDLGKDAVILCYETSDKFCHRHIVAKWLSESLGINIQEIKKV